MTRLFAAVLVLGSCWNPHITINVLEKMVYGINGFYSTMMLAAEQSARKQR
jgi:hypothetical protein